MHIKQPKFNENSFTCPFCNVLAQQVWNSKPLILNGNYYYLHPDYNNDISRYKVISVSTCQSCKKYHLWHNDKMLFPNVATLPMPSNDMPDDVKNIYLEARDVFPTSKKASAALLRLSLHHLFVHLGEEGKNINNDIKELVKKGLDPRIQKSLDILRITGNHAVHPGKIDLDDDETIAVKLFDLMNFITTKMISEPKEIDTFFASMPEKDISLIEKRDNK